jgi:AcrR family transcriptional regulator
MLVVEKKAQPQEWCFVSGQVSVAEVELLPRAFFLELLRSRDVEDIYQRLSKTRYRSIIFSADDVRRLNALVEDFFANEVAALRPFVPDQMIINFFFFSEEIRKLREDILNLPPPQRKEIPAIVEQFCLSVPGNFQELFAEVCLAYLQRAAAGRVTRREFSLFLDSLALSALSSGWAQALPQGTIADSVRQYARYRLVSVVARALETGATCEQIVTSLTLAPTCAPLPEDWEKRLCVLGGKLEPPLLQIFGIKPREEIKSPQILERAADDVATEILLEGKYYTFGPEKVFNYLWAIEIQNKNLRLCVGAVLGKLPTDIIEERLRREFV